MKFDSSKEYQICVSYLIDAFQQLKYNPDIAMERVLLAIDSYSGDKKLVEVYEGAVSLVNEKISNYDLVVLFEKFCKSIPDKTQAFLASRLFRDFNYLKR
ncbi:hypothetical protein HCJ34_06645 [Listeria welshimeri]|nr:hypothetical protein [Listeria welshimeri]